MLLNEKAKEENMKKSSLFCDDKRDYQKISTNKNKTIIKDSKNFNSRIQKNFPKSNNEKMSLDELLSKPNNNTNTIINKKQSKNNIDNKSKNRSFSFKEENKVKNDQIESLKMILMESFSCSNSNNTISSKFNQKKDSEIQKLSYSTTNNNKNANFPKESKKYYHQKSNSRPNITIINSIISKEKLETYSFANPTQVYVKPQYSSRDLEYDSNQIHKADTISNYHISKNII